MRPRILPEPFIEGDKALVGVAGGAVNPVRSSPVGKQFAPIGNLPLSEDCPCKTQLRIRGEKPCHNKSRGCKGSGGNPL